MSDAFEDLSGSFGRADVDAETRRARVSAVFEAVAPRYDLMNDLMSMGLHRLWKRRFVSRLVAESDGPLLDLAAGTGDIAEAFGARAPERAVTLCDPSAGMLAVARKRLGPEARIVEAPAEALPFEDGAFGAVSIAFGLRNFTDPSGALREIARVLRPGGTLAILEFGKPAWWFQPFYTVFSRVAIPAMGALVAGRRDAYAYLVESIARFPEQAAVASALQEAGFTVARRDDLMTGVASIHLGRRS